MVDYDIMTAGQLAKYLQLDEQTVYRKARKGQIPAIRIGKTLRFKKDVIDSWIRLESMQWGNTEREELRSWGKKFAKAKGVKEETLQHFISKRRRSQ